MAWLPIREAAEKLGVSQDTVKRRLRSGQLPGRQEATGSGAGFRWLVELPDDPEQPSHGATVGAGEVAALRELVSVLGGQLEARTREVSELHVLLERQTRLLAAGVPEPASPASPASESGPEGTEGTEQATDTRGWLDRLLGR